MPAGQQAIDLFLGDDSNYVKLPSDGGVEISSSEIGSQHYWTFGTDGDLTVPGDIKSTANTSIIIDGGVLFANVTVQSVDSFGGGVWRMFISSSAYPTLGTIVQVGDTATLAWNNSVTATITSIVQDIGAGTWALHSNQNLITGWYGNPDARTTTINSTQVKTWTFGTDRRLRLPVGGDILDSTGTSVLASSTSSLVNGAYTASLGSDGVLTIPPNGLIIASTGPYGQQHEMRLGDGLSIGQDGGLANYKNVTWSLMGQNSDSGTQIRLPGQEDSDNGLSLLIQHQYANSSIDIESLGNIWSFRYDGALTFPDTTVQTTAWTGVADYNNLINKPNLAGTYQFSVAADDSTQRLISTDEVIKFTGAGGITTSSDAEGAITITGPSLAGLATETFVTTRGYITGSALTGLATETFVTTQGYITGLSWDQLTNKPNLAGTYSWSIAADDSTQVEISAGNLVKIRGAGGITTASDADGNITITGSASDRLTSNARSAVLNANGTFSLPTLAAAPSSPQAGQMALANGTSWDPITQNNGAPYMVIYTGTAWMGLGGVTVDQVYAMILEMG
jgi:hypothetical protein